jgi:hypothetical protein
MAAHGLKMPEIATLVASNFPDAARRMVDQYFSAGLLDRAAPRPVVATPAPFPS